MSMREMELKASSCRLAGVEEHLRTEAREARRELNAKKDLMLNFRRSRRTSLEQLLVHSEWKKVWEQEMRRYFEVANNDREDNPEPQAPCVRDDREKQEYNDTCMQNTTVYFLWMGVGGEKQHVDGQSEWSRGHRCDRDDQCTADDIRPFSDKPVHELNLARQLTHLSHGRWS